MKLPVIKTLVNNHSIPDLQAAEAALYEEEATPFEVEGDDEGEKLTHVLAAIYIKEQIAENGIEYNAALRMYTQRVRSCIS